MHKGFSEFVTVNVVLFRDCELLHWVLVLMSFDMPVLELCKVAVGSNFMDGNIDIAIISSGFIWAWHKVVCGGGQGSNHSEVVAEA